MLAKDLAVLFERDLLKLKTEINAYTDEKNRWRIIDGTANAAGNLTLHLLGNLQHYIGHVLGGSGYQRNRPAEFSSKDVPLETLNHGIDTTIAVVVRTLGALQAADLDKPYPENVFDDRKDMTTGFFLVHLLFHLGYHLGQINYHRRVVEAA